VYYLCLCIAGGSARSFLYLPGKPTLEIDLMFGRNIGHVLGVSEESWDDFVAKEIVPRFDSFTVLDAVGYWQGSKELSKRVLISPKPEDKAVQKRSMTS
jgi:hypothetical protein